MGAKLLACLPAILHDKVECFWFFFKRRENSGLEVLIYIPLANPINHPSPEVEPSQLKSRS